jgi:anion-transporting  ArsA/GET3 family ATPase
MQTIYKIFLFTIVLITSYSCNKNRKSDNLLAKVYGSSLYQSDIDEIINQDSKGFNKKEYIDSWIRNELIIQSSKLSKQDKKEIEYLSETYRKTLEVQKQKEKYLEKNLSLEIDSSQLKEAYLELKESYKLKKDIFKHHLVIIHKQHPEVLDIKNYFKQGDFDEFYESLQGDIEYQFLDSSQWLNWFDLSLKLPFDELEEDNLKEGYNGSFENENYIFFIRIFDFIDKNENAPLSYMEGFLKNAIIEQRKVNLMEEFSNKLYTSALNNNKLIIN